MKEKFILKLFIFGMIFIITKCFQFNPFVSQISRLEIGDGENLKIGVIGDFQISPVKTDVYYRIFSMNLKEALKTLKKREVDMIIMDGDLTDDGEIDSYEEYKEIFNSVFEEKDAKTPYIFPIMGNHDYNHTKDSTHFFRERFHRYTEAYPFNHYIINNYNFIFWSNSNGLVKDTLDDSIEWAKKHLEIAKNKLKKEGDPIFVITHMPPKGTIFGSEGKWGNQQIYDLLKNYPNVISISGHSHYSLKNEKSLWQGDFTAVGTQSTSYLDIDYFYNNWNFTAFNAAYCTMGLIIDVSNTKVEINRLYLSYNEILPNKWIIDIPINKNDFKYVLSKHKKYNKPIFKDNSEINVFDNKILKFTKAISDTYILHYIIQFKSQDFLHKNDFLFYYYSPYYFPPSQESKQSPNFNIEISKYVKSNKYLVSIFAEDIYGNISEPLESYIQILN